MSDKPFDAEVRVHWWGSLCTKRFVGHENAIQNAPCNRPLIGIFSELQAVLTLDEGWLPPQFGYL
jgi:hypothetical protein